jgi:hypothetical protein
MALVMVYIPFETHSAPAMVNIFVKMHIAHYNTFNISFETQTKSTMPFR